MARTKLPIRIEEVPPFSSMALTSMKNKAHEFEGAFPKLNAAFITNVENKIIVIEGRAHTLRLLGEMKAITATIYDKSAEIIGTVRILEGYIIRATGLTIPVENFGISLLRDRIKAKDTEKVVFFLRNLTECLTDDNLDAVKAEGYTDAAKTALVAVTKEISELNVQQNEKKNEMLRLARANKALFIELYDLIANILDAGKRIFFDTDKELVKEFTATHIVKRMRNDQPKKKEEEPVIATGMLTGKMTDKGTGAALEEGTVQVEGTLLVETTDAEGEYQVDGVTAGTVKVKAIMDGYVTLLKENIVIKKDEATELNFEMEPNPPES